LLAARHDADAFAVLDAAYREPQRGYHDWRHIADLLQKLGHFSHLATRPDLIAAAIFWHDAVYATRDASGLLRADAENVRASAALFERHALFDKIDADAIHEMIMATARHLDAKASREHYPGFSKDLDLFLDLDLSALAAQWPVFERNLENIRFEYGWVPENVFCLGRLRMAESFAAQGASLYRRDELRKLWSEAALANLSRSLEELRAKLARLASPA
jgi:predicted metal-dependent HD superfamily phosphohydrolase